MEIVYYGFVRNFYGAICDTSLPAQSFEQYVVTLRAVLDAPQQTHGSVASQILVELHSIEILHGDPSEYCSRLFYVGSASAHQLSHQVRERFLIFLSYLKATPIS